jgi:hypothetical protein
MMRTALSIIQSVCRRVNHPAPTTLIGITDPDELQMIELLYNVCEELRQARCWVQLKRKHTFATVDTRALYPLPEDFFSPLLGTHYNTSLEQSLLVSGSDSEFAGHLYGGEPSSYNFTFRVFGWDENTNSTGGQVELFPTPSSVQNCAFEYLSRTFLLPKMWLPSTAYTIGTYVAVNGNIYICDTDGTSGATPPSTRTQNIVDGTTRWDYVPGAYERIIADTDLVLFDDDLVKLGLRAKLFEERGGDYQSAKAEFDSKVDRAMARYKGSFVGTFGGPAFRKRYRVPDRSWSI